MKNPFKGKQGIAMIAGIVFVPLNFIAPYVQIPSSIVSRVSGLVILAALIALFPPKCRPLGKGFLIGVLATVLALIPLSLLLTVILVLLKRVL